MSDETAEWMQLVATKAMAGSRCPCCQATSGGPTLGMMLGIAESNLVCALCGHLWIGAEAEVKAAVDAHLAQELYDEGRYIIAAMGAGTP